MAWGLLTLIWLTAVKQDLQFLNVKDENLPICCLITSLGVTVSLSGFGPNVKRVSSMLPLKRGGGNLEGEVDSHEAFEIIKGEVIPSNLFLYLGKSWI